MNKNVSKCNAFLIGQDDVLTRICRHDYVLTRKMSVAALKRWKNNNFPLQNPKVSMSLAVRTSENCAERMLSSLLTWIHV